MNHQNRTLSRRWFEEVWNQKRTDSLEEILSPDCAGHMVSGEVPGVEAFKLVRDEFLAAFPDLRFEIEDIVSEGDHVVVRWKASGTHSGEGLGLTATDEPIEVRGITWHRYKDGRIVEGWDGWNQSGLMQDLRQRADERRERADTLRRAISARLRKLREELFGEQGGPEVARRLSIPARTLHDFETGATVPAEVLLNIIEMTGAEPTWLLSGEGPVYRTSQVRSVGELLREALANLEQGGERERMAKSDS